MVGKKCKKCGKHKELRFEVILSSDASKLLDDGIPRMAFYVDVEELPKKEVLEILRCFRERFKNRKHEIN